MHLRKSYILLEINVPKESRVSSTWPRLMLYDAHFVFPNSFLNNTGFDRLPECGHRMPVPVPAGRDGNFRFFFDEAAELPPAKHLEIKDCIVNYVESLRTLLQHPVWQ